MSPSSVDPLSVLRAAGGLVAHPSRLPAWRTHLGRAVGDADSFLGIPLGRFRRGVAGVPGPAPRTDTVLVLASERLVRVLAREWDQRVPAVAGAVADDELAAADLVLVEWTGGPGTAHDLSATALQGLARRTAEAGIPLVVWDTAHGSQPATVPDLDLDVDTADPSRPAAGVPSVRVLVDDPARGAGLEGPGGPAGLLGATFDPRTVNPVNVGRRPRDGVGVRRLPAASGDRPSLPSEVSTVLAGLDSASVADDDPRRWAVTLVVPPAGDDLVGPALLEAAARGGAVATTGDVAAAALPGVVPVAGQGEAVALVALTKHPELRARLAQQATRAALRHWSAPRRADAILTAAGREGRAAPSVSAVVPTMRPGQVDNVLEFLARQEHPQVQLVLVTHGFTLTQPELRARAREHGLDQVMAVGADSSLTLGACMNLGVAAADGSHVAKMDDDNYYGVHYLSDLLAAFEYTDAQVVGKWAHLTYLEGSGAVLLRFPNAEHRYTPLVQGGTLLMSRELALDLRFEDLPRRVDTTFLDKVAAAGGRVYSTDRYGFVSVRRATPGGHTWRITDSELLAKPSQLLFYGEPWTYADV